MKVVPPKSLLRVGRSIAGALVAAVLSCSGVLAQGPDAALKEKFRRPPASVPSPVERAQAAVGDVLFSSRELSIDRSLSCSSCHQADAAWRDARGRSPDRAGQPLPRRAPTVVDLAWAGSLTWDGRMDGLEQQALDPALNARIGGMDRPLIVQRVRDLLAGPPGLLGTWRDAFGDAAVTIDRVSASIAAYERTLVSPPAPFDRWIEGDQDALSPEAQRGFALFAGRARCAVCHSGWRFTDDGFHDIGMPDADLGRGKLFPGEPTLQHAFKTPTLRGVSDVGFYMHDGSLPSLTSVIDHYASGFSRRASLDPDIRPLKLSAQERNDLVAFMNSLSSAQ